VKASQSRPSLCESPELHEEALQCARTCKMCCELARPKSGREAEEETDTMTETGDEEGEMTTTTMPEVGRGHGGLL